jgi:hypothetical protein
MNRVFVTAALFIFSSSCALATLSPWSAPAPLASDAASDGAREDSRAGTPVTNGNDVWISAWSTLNGGDYDISFVRSADNGATWSPRAFLNSLAPTDSGADTDPQLATDGAGNWVAVWHSFNTASGFASDAEIFYSTSSNDGISWSPSQILNADSVTDPYADYFPRIATDGSGNWIVVWIRNGNPIAPPDAGQYLYWAKSTNNGASWTTQQTLDSRPVSNRPFTQHVCRPDVAVSSAGVWLVSCESNSILTAETGTDFDLLVWALNPAMDGWGTPLLLNTTGTSDISGEYFSSLASDNHGSWMAVWYGNNHAPEETDFEIYAATSFDGGKTWSAPTVVNSNSDTAGDGDDRFPNVASDGDGGWVVVWENLLLVGAPRIEYSSSTDFGLTWSPSQLLNTNAGLHANQGPRIASDKKGLWMALWTSTDSLSGSIGTDQDILFSTATLAIDADIVVSVEDHEDPVLVGSAIDYYVNVANAGPASAEGAVLLGTLTGPAQLTSVASAQATCTLGVANDFVCDIGHLPANQDIGVVIKATATAPGIAELLASASSAVADSNQSNNSDVEGTAIAPLPSGPDYTGEILDVRQNCRTSGRFEFCILSVQILARNIGTEKANRGRAIVTLSSDDAPSDDDLVLGSFSGALAAGESRLLTFRRQLPKGQNASNKYVLVVFDALKAVDEIREDNNLARFGPVP